MQKVEIYATRFCPYCVRAKGLLQKKGVEFVEYDLDVNPDLRSVMMERANGGRTVPQIFIGDTHVGGSDDLFALERADKLDTLLNG
ncbi:MAG: glutaredoxin 3 [Pseudomonadota bacterium]